MSLLNQQRILDFFRKENKRLSTIEISQGVNADHTVLNKKLVALRHKGFIRHVGFLEKPNKLVKIWELTGKRGDV